MSNEMKQYGVAILGNCGTHGEFVAAALHAEQFEAHNLTVMPFHDTLIHNGRTISTAEFLKGYELVTPFQQLSRAIETSTPPDSDVESARLGVELLMAAYKSTQNSGQPVALPFEEGANPLVAN